MNEDFRDLLRGLSEVEAHFLVVDAYAVAVHGRPRATGDLDIWVEATETNAKKVYMALERFSAPLDELTEKDLATPGIVFQMGYPPRRIDILTKISGVEFEEAWIRRTHAPFGDIEAPVLGLDDLIANKRASGRPKDLRDAESLVKIHRIETDPGPGSS